VAVAILACFFAVLNMLAVLTSFWPKIRINIFPLSGPNTDRRVLFVIIASATLATLMGMLLVPLSPHNARGTLSKAVDMLKTPTWSFSLSRGPLLEILAVVLWSLMLILFLISIVVPEPFRYVLWAIGTRQILKYRRKARGHLARYNPEAYQALLANQIVPLKG